MDGMRKGLMRGFKKGLENFFIIKTIKKAEKLN